MQINLEDLLTQLRSQVVQITFTKADGSTRVMNATLQEQYLPETQSTISGSGSTQVVKVWDTDINEWRSVRLDRVQDIQL